MRDYQIARLRAYYDQDILSVVNNFIWEKVTVRGLGLSQKAIKQAYKEMKGIKFRGNIIDYLCYICLLDVIRYVASAFQLGVPMKKVLNFLEVYLFVNYPSLNLICRLMIKDETYLEDAFKSFDIIKEDEIYVNVRKILINETNSLMHYKSSEPNKSGKLSRG